MTIISADFDILQLPNLILHKIWVSQSENLGIFNTFNVEFFQKIKIQDLQTDQNCIFLPPTMAKFNFT